MSHHTGRGPTTTRPNPTAIATAALLIPAVILMVAGSAAAAETAPRKTAAPAKTAGPAVSIVPQARASSNYSNEVRLRIANDDVSYEAPPAYQESFAFWTNRLKGSSRAEMYRFLTTTAAAKDDGTVPFRRLLPRFNLEMEFGGQIQVPLGSLEKVVTSQVWTGVMDRQGNVKELKRLQGSDSPDLEQLALPHIEAVFPSLDGPRELRPGEAFSDVASLPLPSKLTIGGLENVRMLVARDYILKEKRGGLAIFEVKTTYASDPASPPTAPGTTCAISGGGDGEATFDLAGGYFLGTRSDSVLRIAIEAPLRPLPDHPETVEGVGHATTRLVIALQLSATQTVASWAGTTGD